MRWPWQPKPSEVWDAIAQGDLAKVQKLLDNGMDVDTTDRQGRCLLSAAIIAEKPNVAMLIIERGPNLNLQDVNGWAPLHFAARHYLPDVVATLIDKEARIDIRDVRGNTPLYRAVFESRGRGEVIQLLLAHKANPRKRNKLGVSPIELAGMITNFNVKQFFNLK